MIYCLNCGKGIPDQSKFCTFCGTPTAQVDPQNPGVATPYTTSQPDIPVEQQPVNPVPPPPQFSSTPPPPPQQFVTPNYQAGQQQQYVAPTPAQQYVRTQPVTTKNEFYKNVGFWGALLVIVSAFLPWVTSGYTLDFDGLNLLNLYSLGFNTSASGDTQAGIIVWEITLGIILICAAILLIDGIANFLSRGFAKFLKILPFIVAILLLFFLFMGLKDKLDSDQFAEKLQTLGLGIWVMLAGVILLLFYKKPVRATRV